MKTINRLLAIAPLMMVLQANAADGGALRACTVGHARFCPVTDRMIRCGLCGDRPCRRVGTGPRGWDEELMRHC